MCAKNVIYCEQSENKKVVIAGDSCSGEVCVCALTFVDCLLLTGAGVDDLYCVGVGLKLSDVEHFVSFVCS